VAGLTLGPPTSSLPLSPGDTMPQASGVLVSGYQPIPLISPRGSLRHPHHDRHPLEQDGRELAAYGVVSVLLT
jgi:hypothetical protein